ncbi:MAG: TonB-dependent receptor [Sphingomonadales bacterium]|jgi:TonB-dependent receptor
MISVTPRRRATTRLALLASLAGTPAFAQTIAAADANAAAAEQAPQPTKAQAGDTETENGELVVVGSRPIAESLAAALATQKASDSLVSVLAADAIGRLPDQNIAQAVSRLPGVSVQRDQGQARYINLRGAPLNWTTLSFDGIYVISPEGRDARYDSIPSALASQVIVQKAVTPDLNGETIAGNVNIVTRSAFDYKGPQIQAKLGTGYVQLGKRQEYEGSLVVSNRWETGIGDIGIVASASYYQRNMVTDNFEIDWEEVDQDLRPLGAGETARRGWAREDENKFYELTRKNYSASGKLEWRPDADNYLFFSSIYSAFTDNEQRDNYRIDADDQQTSAATVAALARPCSAAGTALPAGTTGYADICIGNTPYKGTIYGVDFDYRITGRTFAQSVFTNTLGGDHRFDRVQLKWRGNYTKSVDDRSAPRNLAYQSPSFGTNGVGAVNRVTYDYDFTNPLDRQIRLYRTLRDANGVLSKGAPVASFADFQAPITQAFILDAKDTTEAYTGKLELAIDTDLFGSTVFRFGGQFDKRTKEAVENQLTASGAGLITALNNAGLGAMTSLAGVQRSAPYRGQLNDGYNFTVYDPVKVDTVLGIARNLATFQPVLGNYYKVGEEVWSGFAMGTTKFDWGNIVYGARIEHVRNTGRAYTTIPGLGQTLVTAGSSQTMVFPSAHINWNPRDDMKLRLSFNTGAARPDYDVLRPSFTINDANEIISGGNPFARPERAKGVDLYWEWYLKNGGFISVGAFYKKATSVLFNTTRIFGSNVVNTADKDRSGYRFTTLDNGGSGEIYGVEAAFQMQLDPFLKGNSFWGGFGLLANATWNESKATTPDGRRVAFPGTSRWVVNVGPYFEKYGVSARISYNYRSTWIDSLGGPDTAGDNYWATEDELDASIRVAINKNFEVYVDGANLGNGPGRRFSGVSARTIEWEKQGRRFTAGVRLTY